MITEPDLSHDFLRSALNRLYAVDVRTLEFVRPGGECSWGYVVTTHTGERFFLKLTQQRVCGDEISEQGLIAAGEVAQALGHDRIVTAIQATTGYFLNSIGGYLATFIPLVEGVPMMQTELDDERQHKLGVLIAQIHTFAPIERPPHEKLARHHLRDWGALERALDSPSPTWSAAQRRMATLLDSVRPTMQRLIAEYRVVERQIAEDRRIPLMFCHGDPSPGNVLVRPDGEIALIDWDSPVWGPQERDLFHVRHYPGVMAGYERETGGLTLNEAVMSAYAQVWDIGEVVDYGYRTLLTQQSEAQYVHDVHELEAHIRGLEL